jgi:hypothetical protein
MQRGRDAELRAEWQRRYERIVATAQVDWVEPQVAVVISAVTKLPPSPRLGRARPPRGQYR